MDTKRRWLIWGTLLAGTVAAALYPTPSPTTVAEATVRHSAPAASRQPMAVSAKPGTMTADPQPSGPAPAEAAGQPLAAASDPFAPVSWDAPPKPTPVPAPPPAPVVAPAPVEPQEPPMPYRFLGRMQEDGGKPVIYLARGQDSIVVHIGETFDTQYKLVSADEHKLVIEYLPLNRQHDLAIDAP